MARLIFGPAEPLENVLREASHEHAGGQVRIAVAWARDEGTWRLIDALGGRMAHVEVIVGINERGTTVEALLRLLASVDSLSILYKHRTQTFHPKLYWFATDPTRLDTSTVLVGSSNLTTGGLVTNFEASLLAGALSPGTGEADEQLITTVARIWDDLVASPWRHEIADEAAVRKLYENGYLRLEATVRAERRRTGAKESRRGDLPTAPPTRVGAPDYQPLEIPFAIEPELPEEPAPEDRDPEGLRPLPDRFFVRTLTANDVAKLQGEQVGTFEPDLGETARDQFPAFWGWPDQYEVVRRQVERQEWSTNGRLISSQTPPEGVPVEVMLWFREPRPDHAAEHRVRLGPIGEVRDSAPPDFDTDGLVVVERAPEGSDHDFVVRLVTPEDHGYEDFASYLRHERPQHRFGYGP